MLCLIISGSIKGEGCSQLCGTDHEGKGVLFHTVWICYGRSEVYCVNETM